MKMYTQFFHYYIFLIYLLHFCNSSELEIQEITLKNLKKNDIGLYFDLTVANVPKPPNETLQFTISSSDCCITVPPNDKDCDVSQLICGEFERVATGEKIKVTLVWPTLTLYNRIGYCDINLRSQRANGEQMKMEYKIDFNTTLNEKAIPTFMADFFKDMTSNQNYSTCKTRDLNPFRNCIPERCDEKYFGKRNYFNPKREICEKVPLCNLNAKNMFYDSERNECVDLSNIVTDDDIQRIQSGELDDLWYDNSLNDPVMIKRNSTNGSTNIIIDNSYLDGLTTKIIRKYLADDKATNYSIYLLTLIVAIVTFYMIFTLFVMCILCCSAKMLAKTKIVPLPIIQKKKAAEKKADYDNIE